MNPRDAPSLNSFYDILNLAFLRIYISFYLFIYLFIYLFRRMFPYLEFSLRGVDPVGLYDVIFDIIPASSKSFKFLNNKWIPMGRKEEEFKNNPFKHPDSPRVGSDWMTRKISFEKVKLSNKPGTKAGIVSKITFRHQVLLGKLCIDLEFILIIFI